MRNLRKSITKFLKKHKVKIILATLSLGIISYFVYVLFRMAAWPEWTGFGEYTGPTGDFQRAKTLWDWLELLIVPFALTVLAIWINRQNAAKERNESQARYQAEQQIALDRMREESLQSYLTKITELFLSNKLLSESDSRANTIARAYTLLTLRKLDKERKRILLQFLYEMGLVNVENTLLSMDGADFSEIDFSKVGKSTSGIYTSIYRLHEILENRGSGPEPGETSLIAINLEGANLTNANFSHVDLSVSNLSRTDLSGARIFDTNLESVDLSGAFLEGAKLIGINLSTANLSKVDLSRADLTGSNLRGVNLFRAKLHRTNLNNTDLSGADFTEANLSTSTFQDANLTDAKMTNASIFDTELEKAKSVTGLIMDDGKRVEESTSILGQYLKMVKKL